MLKLNNFDVQLSTEQFRTKLDIKTACKLVGLRYMTFCGKFHKDRVRHAKLDRKLIFDIDDIKNYILSHRSGDWSNTKYSETELVFGEKVDIKECSELLGICYESFYSIMRRENLPCFKYDNKRVFLKKFIQDWLDSKLCLVKENKMENQEHIETLLNQLTKQQQEIASKEKEIQALQQENQKLKQNVPKKEKVKNSGVYKVERVKTGYAYGFTIYDENLKKKRLEHFHTKAEAEAERRKLLELRDKKKLAPYLACQNLTFNDLFDGYLTNARANNFALNTISAADSLYRNHLQFFADMKVHKITKLVAQQWAEEKRYSIGASAYNNCLKLLKAIWNNAYRNDIISLSNPFNILQSIDVKKEKISRKKVLIETEECEKLINTAQSMFNDYTAPAIACAFYAGLREGEVLGLYWSDIDFDNCLITIQRQVQRITQKQLKELMEKYPRLTKREIQLTFRLKTESSKVTIAVPKVLIEKLRTYKEKLEKLGQIHELCFTIDGTPLIARDFIKNRFHKVLNAIYGNKTYMVFHDLRSSCATLLHKKNVPTKVIQKLLRHRKAATTENIYIDVDSTSDYVKGLLNSSFS